jgi:hypothetical protein
MPDDIAKYLLIAMALGLGFLAWRAWQVRQASPSWPTVEGEVLASRVRPRNETGTQHGSQSRQWVIDLRYRYVVAGQTYTGQRLRAFERYHADEASAQQELAPYPAGAKVRVYYDPDRPASSVLIPG